MVIYLIKETFNHWLDDKASRLAAALAYYTVFSLPPLLILVIAIAGTFLGEEAARGEVVQQLQSLIGTDGAKAIEAVIAGASKAGTGSSLSASIISVVILLFGATAVMTQLQDALNTIWGVTPKPGNMIKIFIFQRLLSFGMILGVVFMMLASLIMSAALGIVSKYLGGLFPGLEFISALIDLTISLSVISCLFAMMFKYLPDVKIKWRNVLIGAVITAVLFNLGKYLIGLYLAKSAFNSTFGAAGSLVVLLAWIYYSAQILFLGAEFTQVYARRHGAYIEPKEYAEYMSSEMKAQQGLSAKTKAGDEKK
ncbi:MAG: YihY/virulence factor BrkB family protein [Gammaproteobacteria bacterium]|nr:MAG: YihY/virulence factor BrkB family protein [Gammaproteobacteria bacterium]